MDVFSRRPGPPPDNICFRPHQREKADEGFILADDAGSAHVVVAPLTCRQDRRGLF